MCVCVCVCVREREREREREGGGGERESQRERERERERERGGEREFTYSYLDCTYILVRLLPKVEIAIKDVMTTSPALPITASPNGYRNACMKFTTV